MKTIMKRWRFSCPRCKHLNDGTKATCGNCGQQSVLLVGEDHGTHWFLNLIMIVCTCGLWLIFLMLQPDPPPTLLTTCTACGMPHQPTCETCNTPTAQVEQIG